MKINSVIAALAAFAVLSAEIPQALASSSPTTNVVETMSLQLTAYSQGAPVTNKTAVFKRVEITRFGTKDLIAVLGAATSNDFSASARLLRVTPIVNGTNGTTSTLVKDGTNIVDVSGFFAFGKKGEAVVNTDVDNARVYDAQRYSIRTLQLTDQLLYPALTAHFDLQGFDAATTFRVDLKDVPDYRGHYAVWTVNGTGDDNGTPTLLRGEIEITFQKVTTSEDF